MSSIVMFSSHAQINDRIFTSTALVDSDSSRNQMHSSQLSRLSEKAEESQQALNNLGFMNLEFKPSLCVGSQADAVMAEPAKGSSNNFQGQSGLMRYHSAPSSFLSTLAEEENNRIISQYFSNESSAALDSDRKPVQQDHPAQQNQPSVLNYHQPGDDAPRLSSEQTKFVRRNAQHVSSLKRCLGSISRDDIIKHHHLNAIFENVPDMSQDSYPTASIPILSQAQVSPSGGQQMESYQLNPICSNNLNHGPNNVNGGYPATSKMSLIRQSSSPAGLLSESVTEAQASFENGYVEGPVRNSMDMESTCGNIRMPNKLPRRMNCMRQNSSPSRFLTQMCRDIHASENQAGSGNDDGVLSSGNARSGYISSYSLDQWDDRTVPVNFAGLQNGTVFPSGKRTKEFDEGMKQELSEARTGETGNRSFSALAGHSMNLSRSASAEFAMEELLQDAVPCKVRAKRGCATHPRSIAERVRRTRISERMRKLQELVPNSDKQTVNIADMLDEAVEYVKSLQRQVQELTEKRDKCTCAHKPECTYKS